PQALSSSLFHIIRPPQPKYTLYPYTTLFRSKGEIKHELQTKHRTNKIKNATKRLLNHKTSINKPNLKINSIKSSKRTRHPKTPKDRKSTRLNSSHVSISYAVFCLKKKKKDSK